MWKTIILISVTILTLFLSSCGSYLDNEPPLKIGITTWVGYYPLFYASEKGWLKKNNIELVKMSSLVESVQMYEHGYTNLMLGTQYEYKNLTKKNKDLKIIKFLDKSDGGDMIMSNQNIKTLQDSKLIEVYLEINSVNMLMLKDFMTKYNISKEYVRLINKNQDCIDSLALSQSNKSIIIITYNPFNFTHKVNGFTEIISTKGNDLLVVDVLFTNNEVFHHHKKQIKVLKILIDKSIEIAKTDPTEFFNVISTNIPISHEEYKESIKTIKWINMARSVELSNELEKRNLIEF